MPETATYIYCLVERAGRPPMRGRRKVPHGLPGATAPALVEVAANLWAVTAEVPLERYGPSALEAHLRDINWVADIAVAHESVVEHFAASKDVSAVPMKLFTMFSNEARAVADLRRRRPEISAILKRIRGCQEWGVRVARRQERATSRASRRSTAASTGTAFLAAKKQARDAARDASLKAGVAAEKTFQSLNKLAKGAYRREPPPNATTPPLVDAAFLVSTAKRVKFRAAAARLATECRRAGADLTLTGPWPAYNFVQDERGRL